MPNLQDIDDNPDALKASVDRMMQLRDIRGEICLNHGIRTAEELEKLVEYTLEKNASVSDVNIKAFQEILESSKK